MVLHAVTGQLMTLIYFCGIVVSSAGFKPIDFSDDDADDDDEPKLFNYNLYLQRPHSTRVDSKSKVETLGSVLKGHIQALKNTANKEVDVVFLVDSSTSVGKYNFREEIKFVKKLLSDFTVDVNHTRVSVITFSSREKVLRHVDYLDDRKKDRHKCSLLEEDLKSIDYSGGGTFTLGAFQEAEKVLKNSRATASKAIFLITDGFSNGGDPRPKAMELKKKGVKIFTFGIQNGHVRELFHMASPPKNESCYILDSFEEFEALAKRALHEDLSMGEYVPQRKLKCNRLCVGRNCCDERATCNCGTHTGKYECMCPSGYYGNGLRGGCQACPSGTYKPDRIPGDVYTCSKCPDENHVTEPAATSEHQCVCRKGYRNFNTSGCAVLTCSVLPVPMNGYFVNDKCKNVFNAACGLRCKPGYELRGSSLRICREDGTWSGTPTACNMKTCPTLMKPKNGNMICTTDDFTFSTVCRFTCDTGYKLVGSRKRTCLAIAFWTGINTRCREITCRPLSVIRDGSIHPPACTAGDVAFGTTCSVTCHSGYSLIGPHSKQCLPEGVWTPAAEVNQCDDTSPPFIMCPYNIEVETNLNEDTASVSWQVPLAVDNSGYVPIVTSVPVVMPPSQFPIGTTKVTYIAEDLNKNQADCQFYVIVKDKQIPTIDRCTSPLPIVSPEQYTEISWVEPEFSDNSGQSVRIQRSHAPGLFQAGKTEVTYTAYDSSGNNNTCILRINIIPHPCEYPPVPLNGNRTCFEDEEGIVTCTFTCRNGYDFAIQPASEYKCAFDNVWEPTNQLPISDCSALQLSNEIIQPASFTFAGLVACQQRPELTRLEKAFEHMVTKRVDELCEEGVNCVIRDLETTCYQGDDSNVKVILGRERRSITRQRQLQSRSIRDVHQVNRTNNGELPKPSNITFTYLLAGSVPSSQHLDEDEKLAKQQKLMTAMENIMTTLKKDGNRGDLNLQVNGNQMELADMSFGDSPEFVCEPGSVGVDKSCAKCPVGTFFNVVSEVCESCTLGTFQPLEGQRSCIYCPANTSTPGLHASTEDDCKLLCLPGTFSSNGLEMCETCRKSYYQPQYGQTSCSKCPRRFTTLRRGGRELEDCKEKCTPGYVSRTGVKPCWPCPRGTFQKKSGKSSCTQCPSKADTPTTASTDITQCELEQSDSPQNNPPFDPFGEQQGIELLADECMGEPCLNGATCVTKPFGFDCHCKAGYTGLFCDTDIDECAVNPCLNGGSCVDLLAEYKCVCRTGFKGQKCQKDIDDCKDDPCLNGATCVDAVNSFTCLCPNGFDGLKCQINVNECDTGNCSNGGTCVDEVAGFKCTCPEGITGERCEIDDDDCASGPCQNQASCTDGVGTFKCECLNGFRGRMCEVDINECLSNPCSASATCEDLEGAYRCNCPSGFDGEDCTNEIDIYFQMDFPSTASTTDYAKVSIDRDLTAATVCFWMNTDDSKNQGTPFSYATTEGNNTFTLTDYEGFVFYVNGQGVTTTVKANDGQWRHVCVIWSSNRGSWKIYIDGIPMDSGRNLASGQTIKGGGQLVIGQEQDALGGGFSSPEVFIGKLSQMNVWSYELPLEDIEALRLSCIKQLGDVIAWPDLSGKIRGAVSAEPLDFCKECPTPASIRYGSVEYTGLLAGATATYSCSRGFRVSGRMRTQCLVTGEWFPGSPSCARLQCGYPGMVQNGWIEGQDYTFDNRIRYKCALGYKLVGDETRYCGEHSFWVGDAPKCEQIQCTIPVLSENTLLTNPTPNNQFMPGDDAFFECTAGNQFFTDHDSVYCQRDGTWDRSIPTCDPQKCRAPPQIDGAEDVLTDVLVDEFLVGYVFKYNCTYGNMFSKNSLNPTGEIACLPSGQWEPNLPECVVLQCEEPVAIANGQFHGPGRNFLDRLTYTCITGYELSHNTALECLELGEWGPVPPPECLPIRCGRPDDVLHGFFEGDVFTYSGFVIYECNLGYKLRGVKERECQADGTWSDDVPACKPVSCGKPDSIEWGTVFGRDYTLNNVVRYACDPGFQLDGSEELICRETGTWQNDVPKCRRVECDYPEAVANAYFSDNSFLFEDTVTYNCEEGFYLEGEKTLTCLSNRMWSFAAPHCLPIQCHSPVSIPHGNYRNPEHLEQFGIGTRIQYYCDIGYEISLNSINPNGEIECTAAGQWEANVPECRLVECRQPVPIEHGSLAVTALTYLSKVVYTCDEGYEFEGNNELICEASGNWFGQTPVCNAVECTPPIGVRNGGLDYKDLKLGSVVRYTCNAGYELAGLEVRRCMANVSWSGEAPVCQAVSCGEPEDLTNGFKQFTGITFQSTVTYACNIGYILVGDSIHTCTKDKLWNGGQFPVCEIVQCDKPSHVTSNGRMVGDVYSYQSVIEYICDPGYYIDGQSHRRTCLSTGEWDTPIPVCIAVECPRLTLRNGFTSGFQTEYGTVITLSCKQGYRLSGATERNCSQDGTWTGTVTVCTRYACPRLSSPTNGVVFVQGGIANYECLGGFLMTGESRRECQSDDTWSFSDPTCDPVPCPDITRDEFANGVLSYEQLSFGSSIVYECNPGYLLAGERQLDCLADGTWSGVAPVCDKNKCFRPYAASNSKIIGDDFSFGSTVRYECDVGYKLDVETERVCQADGSWSGAAPSCILIICPRPEVNRNVIVKGTFYTFGSVLEYLCNSGYELVGPKYRNCTIDSIWSGEEPSCIQNECQTPPPLENGRIHGERYDAGSLISYECNEGYTIKGEEFRLCLSDMVWSGSAPFCEKIQCPQPPPLSNGHVIGESRYYGDSVDYGCNTGYELVGKSRRLCLSVGTWGGADPSCIKVTCGVPTLPRNAIYSLPDGGDVGAFEVTAELSCEEGYQGVGSNHQRCKADGKWTETDFKCEVVTCSSYRRLENGFVIGNRFTYGEEIEVHCDEGYELKGNSKFQCLSSGEWSYDTEPYCREITCPTLPEPSNGQLTKHPLNRVGMSVTYSCNAGYRLHGSDRRFCERDGSWSGSDAYCILIICDSPPVVNHALPFDSTTQYYYQNEARYVCQKGYEITTGDAALVCSASDSWIGTIPSCTLVNCGEPESLLNARVDATSFEYNNMANYICNEGFRLKGTESVRCDETGKWVGTLPTCVPINCGEPTLPLNSVLINSRVHTFNSIVTYICDVGYRLNGQSSSTCLATGVWSGTPPICEPVSCGDPPEIENTVRIGNTFDFKSIVTYSCVDGYDLTGMSTLECGYNEAWIGERPVCHALMCGPPPVLDHASTTMTMGESVGSEAEFTCNDGYTLLGSASAICTANKRWEYDSAPSCQPKDCGLPPVVKDGFIATYQGTLLDSVALYQCDDGYYFKGSSSFKCSPDGSWSSEGDTPTCEPVDCGEPSPNAHSTMSSSSYTYDSVVDFTCDAGYSLVGSASLTCTSSGSWSGNPPQCFRISCKPLVLPEDGLLLEGDVNFDTYFGDRVKIGCSSGFTMIGSGEFECLETGLWSADLPKCSPGAFKCASDTGLAHVRQLAEHKPVGSEVTLYCEVGYKSTGVMKSTCQEDQTWSNPGSSCSRVFCGKPRLRDFVNVVRIYSSTFFYNDQISFKCRAGVRPARYPAVVTCLGDGSWDGDIACGVTCKRPCQNGGICLGLNRCKCPAGYGGRVCETAICILPCLNGGKCSSPYQCSCPLGYGGARCQQAICKRECANGGRCLKPNKCKCSHGYTGAFCNNKRIV